MVVSLFSTYNVSCMHAYDLFGLDVGTQHVRYGIHPFSLDEESVAEASDPLHFSIQPQPPICYEIYAYQ